MRIARYDVRRHRPHLLKLAKRTLPSVHPDLVGFQVNYLYDPPMIATFLIETLKEGNPNKDETAMIDNIIERAKAGKTEISKHTVYIQAVYASQVNKTNLEDVCVTTYKDGDPQEVPRLRPGVDHAEKRKSCLFVDGSRTISLDACYDEVDELVHRMTKKVAEQPKLMCHPLRLVDQALVDMNEDSPFVHPILV